MNEQPEVAAAIINGKHVVIAAFITGIFTLFNAIISTVNINLKNDYEELQLNKSDLEEEINILQEKYNKLNIQIEDDKQDIENLKKQNENFEQEINRLNEEIESLNVSKISIFDLDAMDSNEKYWFDHSDDFPISCFTDVANHEHIATHIGFHYETNKQEITNPTYQLNGEYSICEGQIVWSIANDDPAAKAWIEFYSSDTLIHTTESLDAENNPDTKFIFSVKGVNELKIVKNGTEPYYGRLAIIYPYLDLIK